MSDQSQPVYSQGTPQKKPNGPKIVVIVLVIVAALLVCVLVAGKMGVIDIPFLSGRTAASGDSPSAKKNNDKKDSEEIAETVDQTPQKMVDYSSLASQIKTASGSESDEKSDDEDSDDTESSDEDYIFPDSSEKSISESDIENLSNEDLRIAINEIYARHGYTFPTNEEMREYFQGKDWYESDPDMDDQTKVKMSKTEKKNLDKMAAERQKRKDDGDWPY